MRCLRCGCQKKATNEHCEGCGATLGIVCSACSHLNGPTARFCGHCSAALKPIATEASDQSWQHVLRSLNAKDGEPSIKAYETGASNMKHLRVHDPSLRIDFIIDAGERGPKIRNKSFQHSITASRAGKQDILWQDGCIRHGGTGGAPIFPKIAELEAWTIFCVGSTGRRQS
jgi:hypothetical protein